MNDMRQTQTAALATAFAIPDLESQTYGRRREPKHPASEARRLIVRAAHILPVGRPLWLVKRAHPLARS